CEQAMASSYWDAELAERYRRFRYNFTERALSERVVVVAGGTGGLGAATVMLLAREGARLVVGYRANRKRAEALGKSVTEQCGQTLALVEGDLADLAVRLAYLETVRAQGAPLAGAVIFPGDPARVAWEALDAAALEASLRANYVAPVLLAKELGAV